MLIQGKEDIIISMFSDNIQYQIRESLNVLLIMNKESCCEKRSLWVGAKCIGKKKLDTNEKIVKTDKLPCITKVAFSLDELNNTDNLEDGNLSNMLLSHHMTSNGEFMSFEPVTPQYKRLKNWDLNSLALRIMDQKDNSITDGPEMTIFLHIR